MQLQDPQLADNAVGSEPAEGSAHVSWTTSGRTRCAVVSRLPSHFLLQSSEQFGWVGCVGCEGHKVRVELSNEVINVVDLFVFVALFSKDSDPGYKAVSLRSYAGLDNDLSLSCCPS